MRKTKGSKGSVARKTASKSRRISAIMVEKGMPGVRIAKLEDKMGIRAIPVAELELQDVKVPEGMASRQQRWLC